MAVTVAADPEVLARVRTDLGHVLPPLAAEAAALRDALGSAPPSPHVVEPVGVARRRALAPGAAAAARATGTASRRAGRRRGGALGAAPPRARGAVRAALPDRRPGAPPGRTAGPLAPLARSAAPRRTAVRPPHLARAAARRQQPGLPAPRPRHRPPRRRGCCPAPGGRSTPGRRCRAASRSPEPSPPMPRGAPGWATSARAPHPARRPEDGSRSRRLPVAGQAAALALTVGDVARLVDDGNPVVGGAPRPAALRG